MQRGNSDNRDPGPSDPGTPYSFGCQEVNKAKTHAGAEGEQIIFKALPGQGLGLRVPGTPDIFPSLTSVFSPPSFEGGYHSASLGRSLPGLPADLAPALPAPPGDRVSPKQGRAPCQVQNSNGEPSGSGSCGLAGTAFSSRSSSRASRRHCGPHPGDLATSKAGSPMHSVQRPGEEFGGAIQVFSLE